MPGEPDLRDPPVGIDRELYRQLVAAERVQVVEFEVDALARSSTPVVRPLVVVEDVLAIQVVHSCQLSGRRRSSRAAGRRALLE